MNLTIEDIGPCKKILKFQIPKETIESEFDKKTSEVCTSAALPGFRKGKAPRKLVEKRFETMIKDEVKQAVVSDCYQKALEEHKLNPVGNPSFSEIKLEVGQPLNFDVTLEVWPAFDVKQYKGLSLKKKPTNVTNSDIESALLNISLKKAQLTVVKDGSIKKGDYIICDCKIEVGKNTIFEDEDVEILVEDGVEIVNTSVPDFVKKLEGVKSGKDCKVDAKILNSFENQEYRGKDAKLKLLVKEIKRLTKPDVDDNFAKTVGFGSLEDLKANIRKRMEIDKKNWAEDDLRNQILDILIDKIKFDLPQEFVNYHTEDRAYKQQLNLLKRGVPLEDVQKQTEKIMNASADSVMRELKASLILNRIAEEEKIFVTEKEVEQRINDISRMYNTDSERIRKQLERQGSLSSLRSDMRESKVLNLLLKEAKME